MTTFVGRVVNPGTVRGDCLVTRRGFNILASYFHGIARADPTSHDRTNPDLYGRILAGSILCLNQAVGSTTGGMILQCAAQQGIAPAAMLFADHIDSISAAGILLADIWNDNRIIAIDQLGNEFLEAVSTGSVVEIAADGTVTLS
ncbi:DUF126 domain-containing protein [Rhodococcus sp. BP-316]|uniref:aconitase X swivel domain-containing protein n=1 Tax=Rhodococcus sp. BP-316 TaxID=2739445 RepID=UPI001C9A920D|nr:DUF126 domain-containing protein [Rhodococcus sp. BP-316]MBY6681514.1 DUF126 domain-containing protein [Rhodococcus sp. BP-316]